MKSNIFHSCTLFLVALLLSGHANVSPKFENVVKPEVSGKLDLKNTGQAFSHDNRLFAMLLPGKQDPLDLERHIGAQIMIWDTETGKLQHKTEIPVYNQYYAWDVGLSINFTPDNKTIYSIRGASGDILAWDFEEEKQARVICRVGDRNEFEEVLQVSDDKTTYLIQGVNNTNLCGLNYVANPHTETRFPRWQGGSRVLVGKDLHIVGNVYKEGHKDDPWVTEIEKGADFATYWDLGYVSKADRLLKAFDTKNQLFLLLELKGDKVTIKQWNYVSKKQMKSQAFEALRFTHKKFPDQAHTIYLSDNYLLLRLGNNNLTLFKRTGHGFSSVWSKKIELLSAAEEIYFSSDERHIVMDNFVLVSLSTGKIINHLIKSDADYDLVLVDPTVKSVAEKFHTDFPMDEKLIRRTQESSRGKQCSNKELKTNLFSLRSNLITQTIDGEVLAISPDGKTLAICKENTLLLKHQ